MSLLDSISNSQADVRSVVSENEKVIFRNDLTRDNLDDIDPDMIWFYIDQTSLDINSESILKWRSKKLLIHISEIPSVADISSVYLIPYYQTNVLDVCVGVKPDVRSTYGAVHFVLSVYTMFLWVFDVKSVESIRIQWKEGDSHHSGLFSYRDITRFEENIKQRRSWRDSLGRIFSAVVGRPISYLEMFEAITRITSWCLRAKARHRTASEDVADKVTIKQFL